MNPEYLEATYTPEMHIGYEDRLNLLRENVQLLASLWYLASRVTETPQAATDAVNKHFWKLI